MHLFVNITKKFFGMDETNRASTNPLEKTDKSKSTAKIARHINSKDKNFLVLFDKMDRDTKSFMIELLMTGDTSPTSLWFSLFINKGECFGSSCCNGMNEIIPISKGVDSIPERFPSTC